jgi:hypothetical protein
MNSTPAIEWNPTGMRSAKAFCRDRGISDVTLWRWEGRGWIRTANISGKKYVVLESVAEFDRRALAGEFSKAPAGAAAASRSARVANETAIGGANDH